MVAAVEAAFTAASRTQRAAVTAAAAACRAALATQAAPSWARATACRPSAATPWAMDLASEPMPFTVPAMARAHSGAAWLPLPKARVSLPATPMSLPTPVVSFPTMSSTGPMAAPASASWSTHLRVPGDSFVSHCAMPPSLSASFTP